MVTGDARRDGNPKAAEESAVVSNPVAATRPQPIDYGLSRHDMSLHDGRYPLDDGLEYREEKSHEWLWALFLGSIVYLCFCTWGSLHFSDWNWRYAVGFLIIVPISLLYSFPAMEACMGFFGRRRSTPSVMKYKEALRRYEFAEATARAAAYEAEQTLLRQKRSYWEILNGYEFEAATAEVLRRHQFNTRITGGSADGGVDIEASREGYKGVVQCKAHATCVGPHTVRDLFGVIHHSRADFGVIASRAGFTTGAIDFARNKPIFLIDVSDLIAMAEGEDVIGQKLRTIQRL